MRAINESAHGWQANGREDAATCQHPTITLRGRQRSNTPKCTACGKSTSKTTAFTLLHPWGGKHPVNLCPPCARGLSERADDPILITEAGEAFAGGIVRRIWRRVAALQARRPVAMPNDDSGN